MKKKSAPSVCAPGTCGPESPTTTQTTAKAASVSARRSPAPLTADEHELADLAKALGHPARVRILALLVAKNACICGDIADEIPLAQSTVSQHLKHLLDAGLIQGEIDGPRVCYCVDQVRLKRLKVLIASV